MQQVQYDDGAADFVERNLHDVGALRRHEHFFDGHEHVGDGRYQQSDDGDEDEDGKRRAQRLGRTPKVTVQTTGAFDVLRRDWSVRCRSKVQFSFITFPETRWKS